jgi:hypothetical protein
VEVEMAQAESVAPQLMDQIRYLAHSLLTEVALAAHIHPAMEEAEVLAVVLQVAALAVLVTPHPHLHHKEIMAGHLLEMVLPVEVEQAQ